MIFKQVCCKCMVGESYGKANIFLPSTKSTIPELENNWPTTPWERGSKKIITMRHVVIMKYKRRHFGFILIGKKRRQEKKFESYHRMEKETFALNGIPDPLSNQTLSLPVELNTDLQWPTSPQLHSQKYHHGSSLFTQLNEQQVNQSQYIMGEKAGDLLMAFSLSEQDVMLYATLKQKFDEYLGVQEETDRETVDDNILNLNFLTETCNIGAIREEMIRYKFVIGMRDKKIAEALQFDPDLTLSKVWQQEDSNS
ncbi:hypothetical protein J437_LFUL008830 [Ladona fulva]|uniref:Uncharacterized protein n=1 Tax=Ladona fulva TaxID=123851 RepID=A0A8K0KDE2_LADFU|nr:hypothetical protein J437_LFUL008830 [Ladona fulva]